MKKVFSRFAVLASALTLSAFNLHCGSSSGTGTAGQITLNITAPNGDPIAGATVWVPESSSDIVKAIKVDARNKSLTDDQGNTCADPATTALYSACTNASGQAILQCDGTGTVTANVAKGSFASTIQFTCGGSTETESLGTDSINMAVVTGDWDAIENVLAKLGFGDTDGSGSLQLGTEEFTIFDGNSSLSDDDYTNWDKVLDGTVDISDFDVIFINCGNDYESQLTDSTVKSRLQTYVNNGGKLYVTDWSYDYVEQLFPNNIDFEGGGDDQGSTPETSNAAQVGSGSFDDEDAVVEDALLASWLDEVTVNTGNVEDDCSSLADENVNGTLGARNADGTIDLGDFLGSWAQIESNSLSGETGDNATETGADVTVYITGTDVDGEGDDRPMTVSFDQGSNGGRILYSSYHTAHSCLTEGFWPQERVLQYLVFEL